jgi:hypothetical protein
MSRTGNLEPKGSFGWSGGDDRPCLRALRLDSFPTMTAIDRAR